MSSLVSNSLNEWHQANTLSNIEDPNALGGIEFMASQAVRLAMDGLKHGAPTKRKP